jgi:hypothetical protein
MYRVDHATGVTTDPGTTPATQTQPRFFQGGDAVAGTLATVVQAEWLNMVQEEIANAVVASGQTLDKGNRNQLSVALGIGNYVLKAGDTMTGSLNIQGTGLGVAYSPPTTLLFGPWGNGNLVAFGWDATNLRVRIDDSDVGVVPMNINPGSFVAKAGDQMTGNLFTPGLFPCYPAAAACAISADPNYISWVMDPGGYYLQYARNGADGGTLRWYSGGGSIGLMPGGNVVASGSVTATTDLVAGGALRLTSGQWSIGEVVPGSAILQFSHSSTGVGELAINVSGANTISGLSEFAFSNLTGMTLYSPMLGISYQITGTMNRHAFAWNGSVVVAFVDGGGVGLIPPALFADDETAAQHTTFDALAAINGIGLGRFDKELPVPLIAGQTASPNQVFTKTIEVGFLTEHDIEFAGPAHLVRAIQQLSARVQALEGSTAA